MNQNWHVEYKFADSTYSADFKVVPGQTETEEQMRLMLARKNPTWEVLSVELRGPHTDDPGPKGEEGTPGNPGWSSGE